MTQQQLHPESSSKLSTAMSRLTFFDLPIQIRRQIYQYSGLVHRDIRLNYEVPAGICSASYGGLVTADIDRIPSQQISSYNQSLARFLDSSDAPLAKHLNRHCNCPPRTPTLVCTCLPFPSQLLDVSPQIAQEAQSAFFAGNSFIVNASELRGLSSFWYLCPAAIGCLTSLCIVLSECGCASNPSNQCQAERLWCLCQRSCTACTEGRHELPLPVPNLVESWERLCAHLAQHLDPRNLKLAVNYDAVDIEAGRDIFSPMLKLPPIKELAFCLNQGPGHSDLEELARRTTLEVTGRWRDDISPFRYLDLPREIQMHILRFTELVTQYDVALCPEDGATHEVFFEMRATGKSHCSIYLVPFNYICCGCCAFAGDNCCCWARVTGFSTSCICWRLPTAMLFVFRQFRADALSVFYSKNHFVLLSKRDRDSSRP